MMRTVMGAAMAAATFLLTACASAYAPESLTGGFSEKEVAPDVWMIGYGGNGYTTEETVQTYWLYHAAEVALVKGYDAFRIVDEIQLTAHDPGGDRPAVVIRVQNTSALESYQRAQKPWLYARVRLLRKPFTPVPGKVFDAGALKAQLEPYVLGRKCDGNVCPHVHRYLFEAPPAKAS